MKPQDTSDIIRTKALIALAQSELLTLVAARMEFLDTDRDAHDILGKLEIALRHLDTAAEQIVFRMHRNRINDGDALINALQLARNFGEQCRVDTGLSIEWLVELDVADAHMKGAIGLTERVLRTE